MTFILVIAACFVAFRLLAWTTRQGGGSACELYERRLRQGPF